MDYGVKEPIENMIFTVVYLFMLIVGPVILTIWGCK